MTQFQDGFTCYWRIESFHLCIQREDCLLKSQLFHVPLLNSSIWHLELKHSFSNHLGLYLIKDGFPGNTNIDYELSILTTSGWMTREKCFKTRFRENARDGKGDMLDWDNHILENAYLLNGSLTVSCNMSNGATRHSYEQCVMTSRMIPVNKLMHLSLINFTSLKPEHLLNFPAFNVSQLCPSCMFKEIISENTKPENKHVNNVFNDAEDLIQFFKENKFRYVTLRTQSKDFAVHKALLCARSPVFNAMFRGSMKESDSNIVDIDDVDSDTLFLLLQFLHLEPVDNLEWNSAVKLYYAADKYQIELLKKECRSIFMRKLSDKNVCETFVLAETHRDEELRRISQEYFISNSKAILQSVEWTDLLFNRTDFASKLLYKLSENL